MQRLIWFLVLALFWPLSASAERVALVIGNGSYASEARLFNTANDASAVAKALRTAGYDVSEATNLSRLAMEQALRAFRHKADGAEVALVYYSGHAIEIGSQNYLIPTDAQLFDERDARTQTIPLQHLLDEISGASRLAMVVLDACRDNPFANRLLTSDRGRNVGRGLQRPPRRPQNTLIAFAAAAGAITPDGTPGGNSPFTEAFLEAFNGPPKDVRLMLGAVRDGVQRRLGREAEPAVYQSLGGEELVINNRGRPRSGVLTVKASGGGDHRTIAAAVKAAKPGTRIEIYPGRYRGGVTVSKPLEIVGIGARSTILWEAEDANVIQWTAQTGLIANLTLRQAGSKPDTAYAAVYFSNGSASLRGSDLSSQSGSVVAVRGADARPLIAGNVIRDGKETGILVSDRGEGRIEDNEIHGNAYSGIEIKTGGDPLIRDNVIRDGASAGILVRESGKGRIEDNEIHGNALAGIEIKTGGDPLIRDNVIRDGKAGGIYVRDSGKGRIETNEIRGNAYSGIEIKTGGDPLIRDNVIRDGASAGILVTDSGKGRIEKNEIHSNAFSGIQIRAGGDPLIRDNVIRDGKESGISVRDSGKGRIEGNEIHGNAYSGIQIAAGGDPLIRDNVIKGNGYQAIWIYEDGRGRIIDNDLRGNARGAFSIASDAGPVERRGNKE